MEISFKGKKVLVGGASRGIGRSIALAFAGTGADVAICARGPEGVRAVEAELRQHGTKIFGMACDLGDEPQVTGFVNDAAKALGGIDVLVNNASGIGMKDDESGWAASVNIDLLGTARATRAAIPFLEQSKGSIINISSISGLMAVPRTLPYAAVKAALINYTMGQGLALAEADQGQCDRTGVDRVPRRRMGSPQDLGPGALSATPRGHSLGTVRIARGHRQGCALSRQRPCQLGDRTNDRGRRRPVLGVMAHARRAALFSRVSMSSNAPR